MTVHKETSLKVLAVIFRTVELFDQNQEFFAEIAAEGLSVMTGGDFSIDEYIEMQTVYDEFQSPYNLLRGAYNPYSADYWKNAFDYYVDMAIQDGDINNKLDGEEFYGQSESLFYEMLEREDLLKKVYEPFDFDELTDR